MALSKEAMLATSLLSAGGLGGSGVLAYHLFTKDTFRDKLKGTLISDSEADATKWDARSKLLVDDTTETLTPELKAIKTAEGDNKVEKIKDWCNTNLDSYFSDNKELLRDIRKYCAYNIKEKLRNPINTSSWSPEEHEKGLKEAKDEDLSTTMKDIKKKLTTEKIEKDALKDWCGKLDTLVFKGEEDQDFKDAVTYCQDKKAK